MPMQAQLKLRAFSAACAPQGLPDPNASLSPESVLLLYARQYPSLATAQIEGPVEVNGVMIYTFSERVGKKG